MDPIYVTGHRNPDTDSIVAAMAYAALRNAVGDREYEAACLGHVSDETQMVLDRFGFQPPKRLRNMYTQVRDLDFDTPPVLSAAVTLGRAWKQLQKQKNITAVPVANEDGTLYGMLSRENIANYHMELVTVDIAGHNETSQPDGRESQYGADDPETVEDGAFQEVCRIGVGDRGGDQRNAQQQHQKKQLEYV